MKALKILLLNILLLLSVESIATPPPTDYFIADTPGAWSTNGTWDTNSAPPNDQTGGNDDITISVNVTLTGDLDVKSGTVITIDVGDTLTVNGNVDFNNGCTIIVNGVLIVNGNMANNNNSDNVTVNGSVIIDGNYTGGNGSDLGGTGNMDITGSVTTDGTGTIFGSESDCTSDCDNSASEPLPVELGWFNGRLEDEFIILDWATFSEINNEKFEVYKSGTDTLWEILEAVKGLGNSNKLVMYSIIDHAPSDGYNYYKLRQIDYDGKYKDYDIISVYKPKTNEIKDIIIWPNPVHQNDNINIELKGFTGEEVLVIVMNIEGKMFYEKVVVTTKGNDIVVVNSTLPAGPCLIIGSSKKELYKKKVIIE